MSYYVWVGPRDIDCMQDLLFSETICYYSENNIKEKREAHIYGKKFNAFVEEKMKKILLNKPEAKFIFYNPKIAYNLDGSLHQYIVCLNTSNLMNILSDKIYTRYWLRRYVPVLPSIIIDSSDLSFEELENSLGKEEQYVVQQSNSSGGFGTFLLSRENGMLLTLKQNYKELFIISPFIHYGFPVNINAVISRERILIFPMSIQITQKNQNRILYCGADYLAAHDIPDGLKKKIKKYAEKILKHIKQIGYLGIIGIDFLVTDTEIYFLEINPRYQASSFLINIALKENGFPSLTELNLQSFDEIPLSLPQVDELEVNYSFYKYIYSNGSKHLFYVLHQASNNKYISKLVYDGWFPEQFIEDDAYCYSIIFQTNIGSLSPDYRYNLYSNIHGEEEYLRNNLEKRMELKIALLNQGCVISDAALQYLQTQGIIKKAVFSSIDFRLSNGIPINAPVNLKFGELSPFLIDYDGKLILCYYNIKLTEITIEMQPTWNNACTTNGVPFSRIAYLSTDRLRLKHQAVCAFKSMDKGCYFCNVPSKMLNFQQKDFEEVLDCLLQKPTFRHILIGGGSGNQETESKQIISVARMIRNRNKNIPIYLMSLPPKDTETLVAYKEAGITEVAFNIEIWDRAFARQLMPGKGTIPLEHYLNILEQSTLLWGKNGNVRTALIVGLNKNKLLFQATEQLCKLGVQPMFSVFRPLAGTKLEAVVPPSNFELLSIYHNLVNICSKYKMEPGPSCKECRNNMLSL
jgi:glutathione synthase/RimK-type ligase-like ATP-grasp enzyme